MLGFDAADVKARWPVPGPHDDKYTQGVTGVMAGSATYPGAAILCTGAAVAATSGMVRYAGPAAAEGDSATQYTFGRCYDPAAPVQEEPQRVVYGCDSTNVMEEMTWSSWGAGGARGTGTDHLGR